MTCWLNTRMSHRVLGAQTINKGQFYACVPENCTGGMVSPQTAPSALFKNGETQMRITFTILILALITACSEVSTSDVVYLKIPVSEAGQGKIANGFFIRDDLIMTVAHALPKNLDKIEVYYQDDIGDVEQTRGEVYAIDYFNDNALVVVPPIQEIGLSVSVEISGHKTEPCLAVIFRNFGDREVQIR